MWKTIENSSRPKRLRGYLKWVNELPRQRDSVTLAAAVSEFTEKLNYQDRIYEQNAVFIWRDVVGKQISKVTTPDTIRNGILKVKVSKATWRNELQYQKDEIRRKLNSAIGKPIVADIKFV